MTAPITAQRLAECRALAAEEHPTGTTPQILVAAIRDLGREIDRLRGNLRAAPSADTIAPQPITLRSGRTVCAFHQLELPESGVCTGCAGDAKGRPDEPDRRVPVGANAGGSWRGRELFRNPIPAAAATRPETDRT